MTESNMREDRRHPIVDEMRREKILPKGVEESWRPSENLELQRIQRVSKIIQKDRSVVILKKPESHLTLII